MSSKASLLSSRSSFVSKTKNNLSESIKDLRQPSLIKWLSLALWDWSVISVAAFLAYSSESLLGYWVASLVIGNRQHGLAILGHDGAHYAVSKRKGLNDVITGLFSFWPMGIGLSAYRHFHYQHHRYVGTPRDPELVHKRWAGEEFSLPLNGKKLSLYVMKDLLGVAAIDIIRLIKLVKPQKSSDVVFPFITQSLLHGTLLYLGLWPITALWYFSMVSSFWAFFRLRIWLEHVGTLGTYRVSTQWWQALLIAPHHSTYHYEHHMSASVPCWNLKRLREIDLQNSDFTPIALKDLFKQLSVASPLGSGDLPGLRLVLSSESTNSKDQISTMNDDDSEIVYKQAS